MRNVTYSQQRRQRNAAAVRKVFPKKPALEVLEHLRYGHPEGIGNKLDIDEGDIPLAAFNAADIGPVQPAPIGKCLLGKVGRLSQGPDHQPKSDADIGTLTHAPDGGRATTLNPRTMSHVRAKRSANSSDADSES